MSKSKKWKVEWSFFLGTDGRRKYNEVCRRCIHDCKQSLRTMILAFRTISQSGRRKRYNCQDKGRK